MSQVLTKSPKHCANRPGHNINEHFKKLFYGISVIFLSILSLIFLVWLILHSSNPEFSLKEAGIYNLNISSPPRLLNSSIQLTLLSKNPNKKVGIYYNELQVCASYKGQQITNDTSLPPFYQGHEETNLSSANLVRTEPLVEPSDGEMVLNLTTASMEGGDLGFTTVQYQSSPCCYCKSIKFQTRGSVFDFGMTEEQPV